ncbi:hypothetical protein DERP_008175 [Dermatophagoides pteronyssinus]|uniref:Galectin n=1 Tax=Dermatophagoides pteronyssinus TaxID=6956 RepID=A0ABQ8JJY3_DERPT|nr:hypothetical protein DERP_008175 [Dermatophagoides pteronyssinus]
MNRFVIPGNVRFVMNSYVINIDRIFIFIIPSHVRMQVSKVLFNGRQNRLSSSFYFELFSVTFRYGPHTIPHGKRLWIIGEENTLSQIKLLIGSMDFQFLKIIAENDGIQIFNFMDQIWTLSLVT